MHTIIVGTYNKGCPGHHAKEPTGKGVGLLKIDDKFEIADSSWISSGQNPSSICQNGEHIYAACEAIPVFPVEESDQSFPGKPSEIKFKTGNIDHYRIQNYDEKTNMSLKLISKAENIGDFPCKIINFELDCKQFIATAHYGYEGNGGGEVALFKLNRLSRNYEINGYSQVNIDDHVKLMGPLFERQDCAHVHDVIFECEPNQKSLFFTDLGCDSVCWYVWDDLKFVLKKQFQVEPGTGPRHVRKFGRKLYVVGELKNTINVINLDDLDNTEVEIFEVFPESHKHLLPSQNLKLTYPETCGAHIMVHSNGKYLYTSTRFNNFICVFDIKTMKPLQYESTRGECPRQFTLNNDTLVVANQDSHNLVWFGIESDGRLRFQGETKGVCAPAWVEFLQ